MNFKKFAAIFRGYENIRMEYEIIGDHMYIMTPYMACVLGNTKTLPKVLEGLVKQNTEPGETKRKIMKLMESQELDFAMNTRMTFQRHEDYAPCVILQGTDRTGKPYPVLVNAEYFSLTPADPDSIMTKGRTGVVVITGKNGDIYMIMPVRCSQQTLVHILGTVQTFCLEITAEESGIPAPYVRLDDVATMLSNIGTQGPPCGFNSEDAWDRAIFDANQKLQELPVKMYFAKEK